MSSLKSIELKVISLFSILVTSVIFTLIPILVKFKNESTRERLLSIGNAFAGGVFLGGGFSHLLPEASHHFEELGLDRFPIPHILAVTGFLVVFLLEKIIFRHDEHTHFQFHDEENNSEIINSPPNDSPNEKPTLQLQNESQIEVQMVEIKEKKRLFIYSDWKNLFIE